MKELFKVFIKLIETAAISWIVTCGLVFLICLCFVLPFTLRLATGIWLTIALIRSIFTGIKSDK